jgi:hypothetical protein
MLVEVIDEVSTDATTKGGKVAIAHGTPRIRPLPDKQLPLRIADACQLSIEIEKGEGEVEIKAVPPPRWLVDGIYTAGHYGAAVRPIEGIVTAPTIRADGSVLQRPGWDAATGLLYRASMTFAPIPDQPTREDAAAASAKLLEVVTDFPFFEDADRSAWLAMLLSMIGRPAITGQVPLFALTANVRGAGKSLLVDAASIIAYGHTAARMTFADSDEEMRKRITAVAIEAAPAALLDNVDRQLGGAALDAVLTADRWKDRELGFSRTVDLPMRTVWAATGNNLAYRSDIARRVLPILLDSPLEHPESRADFAHKDLLGWVRAHRGELVTAALVILRAYFAADRPSQPGGEFGSFDCWSAVIRGAIVWAGLADPLLTRAAAEESDDSAAVVRGLIGGLLEVDETGEGMTLAEIVKTMTSDPTGERYPTLRATVAEVATARGAIDGRKLGYALRQYRGRVAGGYRIQAGNAHGGVKRWSAVPVGRGGDRWDGGDLSAIAPARLLCVSPPGTQGANTYAPYRDGLGSSPPSPSSPPCPDCRAELIPAEIEVNGWRNWDYGKCGKVVPMQTTGAGVERCTFAECT